MAFSVASINIVEYAMQILVNLPKVLCKVSWQIFKLNEDNQIDLYSEIAFATIWGTKNWPLASKLYNNKGTFNSSSP